MSPTKFYMDRSPKYHELFVILYPLHANLSNDMFLLWYIQDKKTNSDKIRMKTLYLLCPVHILKYWPVHIRKYWLAALPKTNKGNKNVKYNIVVYSSLAWLITESKTMHSVHLPFQCRKVYRLHDQKIRIILLILDFKLERSTIEKTTCKLGENSSFSLFFLIKTGNIRDFLLDIYSA